MNMENRGAQMLSLLEALVRCPRPTSAAAFVSNASGTRASFGNSFRSLFSTSSACLSSPEA